MISEDHYYAYGLKIKSISTNDISSLMSPNITKFGFQGTFSEEVSDFNLNYNEFYLRTYDPQIGRWISPDPYNEFSSSYLAMGCDPIGQIDPSGGSILSAITGTQSVLLNAVATTIAGTLIGGIIGVATGNSNSWKIGAGIGLGLGLIGNKINIGSISSSTKILTISSSFAIGGSVFLNSYNSNFGKGPNIQGAINNQISEGKIIVDESVSNDESFSAALNYVLRVKELNKIFFNLITSGVLGPTDIVFTTNTGLGPSTPGRSDIFMHNNDPESNDIKTGMATQPFEEYLDVLPLADGFNKDVHLQIKISLNPKVNNRSVGADAETIVHEIIVHSLAWISRIRDLRSGAPINDVKLRWAASYKGEGENPTDPTKQHKSLNNLKSKIRILFDKVCNQLRQLFKTKTEKDQFDREYKEDLRFNKVNYPN